MNFYKAAAALVLVAMTLTSCKSPESDTSESAPPAKETRSPAKETISMAAACKEIAPLLEEMGALVGSIDTSPINPDLLEKIDYTLEEMDGIGEAIETEKGAARVWDMTGSVDKLLEATSNGEDDKVIERRSEEVIEAIATLAGDCTKSIVIEN
jgi:hypothetical protein